MVRDQIEFGNRCFNTIPFSLRKTITFRIALWKLKTYCNHLTFGTALLLSHENNKKLTSYVVFEFLFRTVFVDFG